MAVASISNKGKNQGWFANQGSLYLHWRNGPFQWISLEFYVIFKPISVINGWCISYEIGLKWLSLDFTDDKSILIQVMAWCRQATSHHLCQCWPRSMSPSGVTRPQWVNSLRPSDAIWHHRTWSSLVDNARWHQAITQTNVDLSSVRSCGFRLRPIAQEFLKKVLGNY